MKNLFDLLEKAAKQSPKKIAIISEDRIYTYEEYYKYSLSMARYISANFHEKSEPILVLVNDSEYELFAFLGILATGRMYIPISSTYKIEDIRKIKEKIGASLLLDEAKIREILGEEWEEKVSINSNLNPSTSLVTIRESNSSDEPAFAMMTSASTGEAKLCLKTHRSILDMCEVFNESFDFSSEDIFINITSFAFDTSLKSIYLALYNTATLLLINPRDFTTPKKLIDTVNKHGGNILFSSVFAMNLLEKFKAFSYKSMPSLNKVLFSGEKIPAKTLKYWQENIPVTYVNLYAPTEYSFNLTYHIIKSDENYDNIPIGKAFKGSDILIVDEELNEVKQGELLISGLGLAKGYLADEAKTREKFIRLGDKIYYLTGDYAYLGDDGNYYFLGRKDNQIKHYGYRIELEEIELVLSDLADIEEVACIYDENRKEILAIINTDLSETELRTQVSRILPKYKQPKKLLKSDNLPRTINGKIDRKKLKERYIK